MCCMLGFSATISDLFSYEIYVTDTAVSLQTLTHLRLHVSVYMDRCQDLFLVLDLEHVLCLVPAAGMCQVMCQAIL